MAGRLDTALDALEPRPRLVDWSILACVLAEAATGILSLGAGAPAQWPLFWIHRVVGLALVVLLFFKLRRVKSRLRPGRWERSTAVSVLLAVVAVAALATGVAWVLGADVDLRFWTLLNLHIGLGVLLVPLVAVHLLSRYRPVRRVDFEGRRTALQYGALLLGGAVVYRLQEATNALAETPGAARRFTGSKPVGGGEEADAGDGNGAFPVTSWVADDPDPLDRDAWTLRVDGLVESPLDLDYEDVDVDEETTALLDCTSGWYTVQRWRGVRLGAVLDAAGVAGVDVAPGDEAAGAGVGGPARWVTVHSVTGYRWSYPIEEARGMLLATHVGGERLSHGHGFPLRLVAPDRRGFQWVKWVTRVEVRRRRDASQYLATLVSGFG